MCRDTRGLTRRRYLLGVGTTALVTGCVGDKSKRLEPPDLDTPLAKRYDHIERETVYRTANGTQLRVVASLPHVRGPIPVLMHYHGGAYRSGEPGYRGMDRLAQAGIAVLSVEYRLSDTATYPAAVRDVIASLQWVQSGGPDWNIDPDRVALTGDSAGAHLAALAAAEPDHPNFQPETASTDTPLDIDGLIPHYGIFDFRPDWVCERGSTRGPLTEFLGTACTEATELRAEASPAAHVDRDHPPVLLFHGADDTVLPVKTARSYRDTLEDAGVSVEYREFDGVGHQYFARDTDRQEAVFKESHRRMVTTLFEGPWSGV